MTKAPIDSPVFLVYDDIIWLKPQSGVQRAFLVCNETSFGRRIKEIAEVQVVKRRGGTVSYHGIQSLNLKLGLGVCSVVIMP
jgi:hypothetical protein